VRTEVLKDPGEVARDAVTYVCHGTSQEEEKVRGRPLGTKFNPPERRHVQASKELQ